MPKATINNPSKSMHGQKRGTAGVKSRGSFADPTKKQKVVRQCAGCSIRIGEKNKTGFCKGCNMAATRNPTAGHHYFGMYLLQGCRCEACVASAEAYYAYSERYRQQRRAS